MEMCKHYTVKSELGQSFIPWCSYLEVRASLRCHEKNPYCFYYEPSVEMLDKPNVVGNAEL